MPKLLINQSINGAGPIIDWNGNTPPGTLRIKGIWAGAYVILEGAINDNIEISQDWFDLGASSLFIQNTTTDFKMSPGKLRMTVYNAGVGTNLTADISPG